MKTIKRILILTLVIVLTISSASTIAFAGDIDYNQWSSGGVYPSDITNTEYYTAVRVLIDRGVITGDSDGLFHPGKSITRAEFAAIMAKSTNNTGSLEEAAKSNYFSDLSGYEWAKPYINAAAQAGLIQGVGGGKYQPGRDVTYAEAVTSILRAAAPTYSQNSVGVWPQNVISYAQMYNIPGDTIISNWMGAATKGNVAKLVYRNMPKDGTAAGDITLSKPTVRVALGATTISVPAAPASSSITATYQWYWYNSLLGTTTAIVAGTSNVLNVTPVTAGDYYYVKVKTNKIGYKETVKTSANCNVIP